MMDNLTKLNQVLGGQVRENVPLAPLTTLKIGGPAKYLFIARTSEELIKAVQTAIKLSLPYYLLGGGSNILISDKGFPGLIIHNQTSNIKVIQRIDKIIHGMKKQEILLQVDSGVMMNRLVRYCCDEGLAGLEMHLGLPGTVGGALYMNSKWTNPDAYVGDVLFMAELIDKNGQIKNVNREYFNFGYDQSILQETHEVVVTATFKLKKADPSKLWDTANASILYRKKTQPIGVNTAGCTFRNIGSAEAVKIKGPNMTKSAGYLIDQVGLKGYTSGKAQFSTVHANFIYNLGGATSKDVKILIDEAKRRVYDRFGVKINPEIVLLGEFN